MTAASLKHFRRLTAAALGTLLLPLVMDSCSSTKPKIAGLPQNLPDIQLAATTNTPTHHMASYEYPFDSSGNYVSDWAAEGERRAGRSAAATSDDESRWSNSHGGRSGSSSKTKGKTAASKSRKSDDDAPPKKSSTASSSKSKTTSSKSGTRYVVKSSDTVEKIARRFGVSVKALKAANGLKSDLIRDGQTLKIPT